MRSPDMACLLYTSPHDFNQRPLAAPVFAPQKPAGTKKRKMCIRDSIHRIRKSQRLSMDRAAELAGISVSMWGQVERCLLYTSIVGWKISSDVQTVTVYDMRPGPVQLMQSNYTCLLYTSAACAARGQRCR